jgi:hypothetical protein
MQTGPQLSMIRRTAKRYCGDQDNIFHVTRKYNDTILEHATETVVSLAVLL